MKQFFKKFPTHPKLSSLDLIVLHIVGIYLIFGLLWILFSDSLLLSNVSNYSQFTQYSTYKGVAFVLITSALLYLLVRKTLHQQRKIETSLKLSEERWKFALEGSGDGVWDWNLETDHVFRSARWHKIYGYSENEIIPSANAGRALIHPDDMRSQVDDVNVYLDGETNIYVSEFRMCCKDGSWKWTLSRGMVVSKSKEGKPLRMIGTHTDITARKQSEAEVVRLAHYDLTTNLPNRMLFLDRFKQAIIKAHRTNQTVTLMFLDLDRFKEVNDTLGHDIGDLLLKETAQRLESCVREVDTVARLGGDEFTLILNNVDNQGSIERIAQEILDKLAKLRIPRKLDTHSTANWTV